MEISEKIELNKKVRSYTGENSFITSLQKQLKNSKYLQKIRVGSRDIKVLSDKYKVDIAKRDGLWKEYSDILAIAKKLKESIVLSEDDEKTFDDLIVRIAKAFKANERTSGKKLSTPNTQCAADVLKAHIDHNRV